MVSSEGLCACILSEHYLLNSRWCNFSEHHSHCCVNGEELTIMPGWCVQSLVLLLYDLDIWERPKY